MQISDKKTFAGGGMDSDSSPELVAKNDYLEAYNARITGTTEGEVGVVTNIESTTPISVTREPGLNKAIGGEKFETIRKGIGFIYNSHGFHQITEIDFDTDVETVLFTNKTNSGGIDILPLDPECYINDIKLIGGQYLVFGNTCIPPCYVDLEKLRKGEYGVLTQEDFLLIKAQLLVPPTAVYANDASRAVNLMAGKLFQYRTKLVYIGNEQSALSTISKRVIPQSEGTPSVGTDVSSNNNQTVKTGIGSSRVERVIVEARYGTYDWFIIKDKKRADILALANTSVNLSNQIYEAYDPATGLYSFTFYNDGLYVNGDVLESDLLADNVPLTAGAIEVLNGNVLALADVTTGYDRPTPDVTLGVSSYSPNVTSEIPSTANVLSATYEEFVSGSAVTGFFRVYIDFKGLPKTNDIINIITSNLENEIYTDRIVSYTVQAGTEDNLLSTIQTLASTLAWPTTVTSENGGVRLYLSGRRRSETPNNGIEHIYNLNIDLANASTGAFKSVSALKSNSSYQLALAHYDAWGRPFPIVSDDSYIVKTQSFAQLRGQSSAINWTFNNTKAPDGAVSAQWLLSPNNTHQKNLFVVGKIATSTTNYLTININSLKEYNKGNEASILEYDYSKGDRATLHYYEGSTTQWLINPSIEVEVLGFEIEAITTPSPTTNYLLKIRKPSDLNVTEATGKSIMLEIFSPKLRAVENSDGKASITPTVFYEIGEQISIANGQYSKTSGIITDGDVYFKTRQYEHPITNTLTTYTVEDFNFSDFYISNFCSFGRPRSYYDVNERENRKATILYSDTFRLGSEINGITRFFAERSYGDGDGETASNYGAIEKMRQRDNYLVILQSLKIGHAQIFGSIIEDQAGQQQIAISDKILGQTRYLQSGSYGMGGAKESYAESRNGTIYFIDFNNSEPVRDGYDGVRPISGKMSKYFKRTLQEAKKSGKKVIGWFDDFNNEYVIAIETRGDILTSFAFSSDNWSIQDTYTVIPANLSVAVGPTKGGLSINTTTGIATYTPNIGETGNDSFTFSFLNGGTQVTKKACIVIQAGVTNVFDFIIADLYNREISTVYYSSSVLVDGNNIPTPISISGGGEYQITRNGVAQSWTNVSGYANNGDFVKVRQTSSASYETTVNTTLTIGNKSDTFSVTTRMEVTPPGDLFNATVDNVSSIAIRLQVLDSSTSQILYDTQIEASGTDTEEIYPTLPGGTFTIILSSNTNNPLISSVILTINGVDETVDNVFGGFYYYNLVPKTTALNIELS
jgi:hypothetical protein